MDMVADVRKPGPCLPVLLYPQLIVRFSASTRAVAACEYSYSTSGNPVGLLERVFLISLSMRGGSPLLYCGRTSMCTYEYISRDL